MTVLEYLQKKGMIPYADSAGGERTEEEISEQVQAAHPKNQVD